MTTELPKSVDEVLTEIASSYGIPTLKTRNHDSLDFHSLSVASIKAMLDEAFSYGYKKGVESTKHNTVYGNGSFKV